MMSNRELKGVILIGGIFGLVTILIGLVSSIAVFFTENWIFFVAGFILLFSPSLIYKIYEYFYFNGSNFNAIKQDIKIYVDNCNNLNNHIEELKKLKSSFTTYDYGSGSLYDNSSYNFKRSEWSNIIKNNQVYNCSSSVCKSASNQPFKYLLKYFNIELNEETLSVFENMLNNFSSASEGKKLLVKERNQLVERIKQSIPKIIMKYSRDKLIKNLGFNDIDLSKLYFPVYTFQYISAGGNSQYRFDIHLNEDNLEKLINYMGGLISFKKSVAGQRQLMTKQLRTKIKNRDNHTCRSCGISVREEQNLLLEIDHIIPLSKGGLTEENNLQTLCWRCNRSKGSKIL